MGQRRSRKQTLLMPVDHAELAAVAGAEADLLAGSAVEWVLVAQQLELVLRVNLLNISHIDRSEEDGFGLR